MTPSEIKRFCRGKSAVLVAGSTASGKSAFGLQLAEMLDGIIINADAIQVYDGWNVLSARPGSSDLEQAPHHLYGHVPLLTPYSTGAWLREVSSILDTTQKMPIILGGTGLYFQALTQGLADIPEISSKTQSLADGYEVKFGKDYFRDVLEEKDPNALSHIDPNNPVRTRRAWEVWTETGRPLRDWQKETGKPRLPFGKISAFTLNASVEWINDRIERRFHQMIDQGALQECQAVLDANLWQPEHPSCKAIGAKELIDHIQNESDLDDVIAPMEAAKFSWNSRYDAELKFRRYFMRKSRVQFYQAV